jgi:hypothetical protein
MPTQGGCHPACQAYKQKPECRRFKSCPPDQSDLRKIGQTMDTKEKSLYQQIHPLKLFTDITAGLVSLYIFWEHDLITGVAVAFIPSLVATAILMRYSNLERLKHSSFGQYVSKYMTTSMQVLRLGGNFIMIFGAWYHLFWLILIGSCAIVPAWLRGIIFPAK